MSNRVFCSEEFLLPHILSHNLYCNDPVSAQPTNIMPHRGAQMKCIGTDGIA